MNQEEDEVHKQILSLSAYMIQRFWKRYQTIRALRQVIQSKREPIVIYFSTITYKQKMKSDTDRIFYLLDALKLKFYKFDLVDNQIAQGWVKELLNKYPLPFVVINGLYIGGQEELQVLYEGGLVPAIVEKEYLKQCIICKNPKEGDECKQCNVPYDFFKIPL